MTTLKERVIKTVNSLLRGEKHPLYKDIYNHKVILAPQQESIHFSFRFSNAQHNYFVLSLMVQLRETHPVVQCHVCLLDPRRIFIRRQFSVEEKVPLSRTLPTLMQDPMTNNHYKMHRKLPMALLVGEYEESVEKNLTLFLKRVEEEKFEW